MKTVAATNDQTEPALAALLVVRGEYEVIRKTMRHLRAQTARDRLEVLIATSDQAALAPAAQELVGFHSVRIVEVGPINSVAAVRARLILQARADTVVFVEDHCYPDPGWAEGLIRAHQDQWAGVGPLMRNANPETLVSQAMHVAYFGRWVDPAQSGEVSYTAWHNSSYKRCLLMEMSEQLPALLKFEAFLQDALRERGHRFYCTADSITAHVNLSRGSCWLLQSYWAGRLYGSIRAQVHSWSVARRLAQVLASPLVAPVRLCRLLRGANRGLALPPRVVPALFAGLALHTIGEAVGCLAGMGPAEERYTEFELNRQPYLRESERGLVRV